jgi:uncharacterized protein (DUF433 family)
MNARKPNPQPWWESVPGRCGGAPVFTGTRLTVDTVRACLDRGLTVARIRQMYPELTSEQIARVRRG